MKTNSLKQTALLLFASLPFFGHYPTALAATRTPSTPPIIATMMVYGTFEPGGTVTDHY